VRKVPRKANERARFESLCAVDGPLVSDPRRDPARNNNKTGLELRPYEVAPPGSAASTPMACACDSADVVDRELNLERGEPSPGAAAAATGVLVGLRSRSRGVTLLTLRR